MAMQVRIQMDDGNARLSLSGRFDFNSHREFRNAYEDVIKSSGVNVVEIDLGGVDYIDSSALGMLLLFKEKASATNKKVILLNCRGIVLQILEVANFNKLFIIK